MALDPEDPLLEVALYLEGDERKVGSDWRYRFHVSIFNFLGSLPTLLLIFIIRIYQTAISPMLGKNCRFNPTCSEFAIQSLSKKGFFVGIYSSIHRISRCNPLFRGGDDPVV